MVRSPGVCVAGAELGEASWFGSGASARPWDAPGLSLRASELVRIQKCLFLLPCWEGLFFFSLKNFPSVPSLFTPFGFVTACAVLIVK